MKKLIQALFVGAGIFIITAPVFPASYGDVVINELMWMGTSESSYDEWIELFNNTDGSIDLSGWTLAATDGTPSISLLGSISANGYFLLERTDDTSIKDIAADQIYNGDLGNSSPENLQLKDNGAQVIDGVDCSGGWFAGTSTPTMSSMERINPLYNGSASINWGTNNGVTRNGTDAGDNPINGTPKAQNSVYDISLSVEVSEFTLTQSKNDVILHWTTESEVDVLGFYISRSENREGPFVDLNTILIPSKGNGSDRQRYEFWDRSLNKEGIYWYRLEELNRQGKRQFLEETSILIAQSSIKPEAYKIFYNYPNPFNPSTKICYEISGEDASIPTVLTIYNLYGQEIRTLVNGIGKAGSHSVNWDGRNRDGVDVPSGIYFYQLQVGNEFIEMKKMLKVK